MKKMNVLVSVIIPVFNVEEYLTDCVESVIKQSYQDIEILLVDDGSTDRSGEICDEFAKKDARIQVIHKKNGGLSEARNTAISIANGEYIYFLDSDDIIAEDAIEILTTFCIEKKADLAITGITGFEEKTEISKKKKGDYIELGAEDVIKRMLLNQGIGHEACGKLYHKSLWLHHSFPVGSLYEDYATIYYVVAEAKKIGVYSLPKYYYRIRMGSIMQSSITERHLVILDISDSVTEYLGEKFPDIIPQALRMNIVTYLKTLKRILDSGFNAFSETQKRILVHVKNNAKVFLKSKDVRIIDKIKLVSLYFGKRTFYYIYKAGDYFNRV